MYKRQEEPRVEAVHTGLECGIFGGHCEGLDSVSFAVSYTHLGVFPIQENGAWTLRCIVHQLFGDTGAVLLAAIFTLRCV